MNRLVRSLKSFGAFLVLFAGMTGAVRAVDLSEAVILVASDRLVGSIYEQTVILAAPLPQGGHLGFIVNRPTKITLGQLFPQHGPSQKVPDPVYVGGPINAESIFALVQTKKHPGGRSVKLTDDLFLPLPYGIGIKQGNDAMKRWVDSRLNIMRKRDAFYPIMKASVPARNLAAFAKNILRPKQVFYYTKGDATSQCP